MIDNLDLRFNKDARQQALNKQALFFVVKFVPTKYEQVKNFTTAQTAFENKKRHSNSCAFVVM